MDLFPHSLVFHIFQDLIKYGHFILLFEIIYFFIDTIGASQMLFKNIILQFDIISFKDKVHPILKYSKLITNDYQRL